MSKTLRIDLEYFAKTYGLDVLLTAAIVGKKGDRKLIITGEKEGRK